MSLDLKELLAITEPLSDELVKGRTAYMEYLQAIRTDFLDPLAAMLRKERPDYPPKDIEHPWFELCTQIELLAIFLNLDPLTRANRALQQIVESAKLLEEMAPPEVSVVAKKGKGRIK